MIKLKAYNAAGEIIKFGYEDGISAEQPQAISDITLAMLLRPDTKKIEIEVGE